MTENSIIPFQYGERQVRVISRDGEPWFVAADVCEILGLSNPRKAIAGLDDDEKNTVTFGYGIPQRGNPNLNIISESGFYTVLIRSNKPEAKPFRRGVTHEVLPAIRKTGGYAVQHEDRGDRELTQKVLEMQDSIEWLTRQVTGDYDPVDHVMMFITGRMLSGNGFSLTDANLYEGYQGYCRNKCCVPVPKVVFLRRMDSIAALGRQELGKLRRKH